MYAERVAGTDEKGTTNGTAHFKASAVLQGKYQPHSADNWLVISFPTICLKSHVAYISKQIRTALSLSRSYKLQYTVPG